MTEHKGSEETNLDGGANHATKWLRLGLVWPKVTNTGQRALEKLSQLCLRKSPAHYLLFLWGAYCKLKAPAPRRWNHLLACWPLALWRSGCASVLVRFFLTWGKLVSRIPPLINLPGQWAMSPVATLWLAEISAEIHFSSFDFSSPTRRTCKQ